MLQRPIQNSLLRAGNMQRNKDLKIPVVNWHKNSKTACPPKWQKVEEELSDLANFLGHYQQFGLHIDPMFWSDPHLCRITKQLPPLTRIPVKWNQAEVGQFQN